ncbi:MAG: lytic transglycosylase domain-containing protein [Succinivibrionaceae bacterium]|nr:lytic transglycosylase domain-containing protein [Succinivibrionaceae bacterium]
MRALIAVIGLCLCSSAALAVSQADFQELAGKCAPDVAFDTLQAIVQTESGFNEFAIGVVGGAVRQPESKADAEMAIRALDAAGVNYSVGLGQINRSNFAALGLTASDALEPCRNLRAAQTVLKICHRKYKNLASTISCYFSGNDIIGFREGYVESVLSNAEKHIAPRMPEPREPEIAATGNESVPGFIF